MAVLFLFQFVFVFRLAGFPSLLYAFETWTLNGGLKRRLNFYGTMSLRRILGYRWQDRMSNDLVLREGRLRQVTCIVRQPNYATFFGVLFEEDEHGGLGVCLGDGQTETEKVPLPSGRGDALLRHLLPHLT